MDKFWPLPPYTRKSLPSANDEFIAYSGYFDLIGHMVGRPGDG